MLTAFQHCLQHQPDLLSVIIYIAQQAGQAAILQLLMGADLGPQQIVHEEAVYEVTVRRVEAG